ncbi:MAG: hypothetical protein WBF87_15235, partial [Mesorhizobium sp.]
DLFRFLPSSRNMAYGWSTLVYYSGGTFQIEETSKGRIVRYDLNSARAQLIGLLGALVFLLWIASNGYPNLAVGFAVFMVMMQVAVIKLLAWLRIPRRVRAFVKYGY